MPDLPISDQCTDDIQQIVINVPCQLAVRAEKYAAATGNTITGVVIEALDTLLRKPPKNIA